LPDVILPVLDEAEALPRVLKAIPEGYNPIVVDNGSSDGSGKIALGLGAHVVREGQRGFGAACFAGLLAASDEIVCFMDCDDSLDPAELPGLVAKYNSGADLVIGARLPEPGAWPLHARLANRALAMELRRRTGLKLSDLGPMRVTGRKRLLGLGMEDRRSGWPLEMVLRAAAAGWEVTEVPVPLSGRSGRSKVTGTLRGTLQAISDMSAQLRKIEVGR
jgi:glycosyltransferase involved in cell wall biosynthesis